MPWSPPRRHHPVVAILLAAFVAADARADSKKDAEKKTCADAYTSAQQLRNQRKLVAAREQLLVCARDVCPSVLSADCARWLNEVDQSTPSIVLLAQDASGAAIVDAKATIDGKPLATKLDGRATPVDPGQHTIRVEAAQGAKEESLVVAEGEKNRKIVLTLGAPAPAATQAKAHPEEHHEEAASKKGVPAIAWVLGGVGVVGLGSFAAFGLMGNKQASDDRAAGGCKPNCTSDEVSSIKTKYLIADVSLGVGVVSAAVATYLFVSSSGSAEQQTGKLHVDVAPTKSGGAFSVAGTF